VTHPRRFPDLYQPTIRKVDFLRLALTKDSSNLFNRWNRSFLERLNDTPSLRLRKDLSHVRALHPVMGVSIAGCAHVCAQSDGLSAV
jgi:hypothetical protein